MAIRNSGTNATRYWVCGSPNGTEVGSEPYRKPNLELARQLVKESGYDGTPVVLIGGSDIPAYQRLSLVTVDLLQKIGFKVDLQLSDWGSVATRRQKKDKPSEGGWNLFHTSANGAQLGQPADQPLNHHHLRRQELLWLAVRPGRGRHAPPLHPRTGRSETHGTAAGHAPSSWEVAPIFRLASSCSRSCGEATSPVC